MFSYVLLYINALLLVWLCCVQVSASPSMKPDLRDIHSIPAGKVDAVVDQIAVPDAYPHFTPFVENKRQVRQRRHTGCLCMLFCEPMPQMSLWPSHVGCHRTCLVDVPGGHWTAHACTIPGLVGSPGLPTSLAAFTLPSVVRCTHWGGCITNAGFDGVYIVCACLPFPCCALLCCALLWCAVRGDVQPLHPGPQRLLV